MEIKSKDFSLQEEFSVIEKTLTIKEAKAQNATHYPRIVLRNGRGQVAQPISEELALKSGFPKRNLPVEYKIGVGDTITFSRLIENNRSTLNKTKNWPKQTVATKYKLGIGDTLVLTIIKKDFETSAVTPMGSEQNQSVIINYKNDSPTSKGRVDR